MNLIQADVGYLMSLLFPYAIFLSYISKEKHVRYVTVAFLLMISLAFIYYDFIVNDLMKFISFIGVVGALFRLKLDNIRLLSCAAEKQE